MRIVAAIFAAAIFLHFAMGVAVRSVLGPGMEQAVGNVKALGEAGRSEGLPVVDEVARRRGADRPRPARIERDADDVRPGGWGQAPAR